MFNSKIYVLVLLMAFAPCSWGQTKQVRGSVSDGKAPLANVNIKIKGTDTNTLTDGEGKYQIEVYEGEMLVFSHQGKKTVEIVVEDITRNLNVTLKSWVEELDEVVVTKRRKKSQNELFKEYNTNKNLIKTSFGILDKESLGHSLKVVDGDDLSPAGQDFVDALESWIPASYVFRPSAFRIAAQGSLTQLTKQGRPSDLTAPILYLPRALRHPKPVPAIFEIDGVLTTVAPTFIHTSDIERIAVLESLAGLGKYGSLGAGGVVIINTKTGNFSPKEPEEKPPLDQALLRDNYFVEKDVVLESSLETPIYLEKIAKAKDQKEARTVYAEMEKRYASSPYFYLDCFTHFSELKGDMKHAIRIVKTLEKRFASNPAVLKALAYKLEAQGLNQEAHRVYIKVFQLRPDYVQSYKNLAYSYKNIGEIEKSAALYARYNYLIGESILGESDEFESVMDKDFKNLLVLNGEKLPKGATRSLEKSDDFDGTRLVFEWNDGEAEFEIQFVDPNGQYFTWAHSLDADPSRITEEKQIGFSSEEYLIYKPLNGTWKVNIKYLGNKQLTPAYLKTTVYHNFNTANQTKEIKVFKLRARNVNQQLFALN
ncbi:carboxypeptidase-like regulatory domain-containing protein [Flagellimonas myxillae]|uniref:carboxypeptidase-like regulatory domain-containing protein n=1 Tax=Flagellimonas myxillae TaxID=2942214 RepID=UPI00201EC341|nr:carboxypeptidase-like regulatory domain-containing protein [Muricauda myxillae]MCL6266125.1 carboxypeptidase-like regulatory domain-containing protein [Muricauda myxillae]